MKRIASQPRKVRKALFTAPLHKKRKMLSAHLSEELMLKYNLRSLPVRKGDMIKVMRGTFKGHIGKIANVDTNSRKITIEGVTIAKSDKAQVAKPIDSSNVLITKLDLSDPLRSKKLELRKEKIKIERKRKKKEKKEEPKEKDETEKEKANPQELPKAIPRNVRNAEHSVVEVEKKEIEERKEEKKPEEEKKETAREKEEKKIEELEKKTEEKIEGKKKELKETAEKKEHRKLEEKEETKEKAVKARLEEKTSQEEEKVTGEKEDVKNE